jgi:hypothetical protein
MQRVGEDEDEDEEKKKRWEVGEVVPGERMACHSESGFSTGYDMLRDGAEELKSEPRKGIVGIDLRVVARWKEPMPWRRLAVRVVVVWEKVYSVRMMVGNEGKRMEVVRVRAYMFEGCGREGA